jgi:hypothetical protein
MSAGWNKLTWGFGTWGLLGNITFSVTGQALTASLGNETSKTDYINTPTGQALTAALSSLSSVIGTTSAYPTGQALTATLASADAGPDAMLSTNLATMALGSVSAFNQAGWGRQHWGDNAWGVEGTWVTAAVTGQALTAALGTGTSVEANATLTLNTLNVAQVTLGAVDPAPDAMITGNFMIAALGTISGVADVTVSPTGQALTATLGTATLDANTIPTITGIGLTAALGTGTSVVANAVIDVTGFGLTVAVGSGSALIWNEVDTGSAPIDPPGWQTVAA